MNNHIKKVLSSFLAVLMIMTVALTGSAANITSDKARDIALSDANVSRSDAEFTKTKLETENGKAVYEIEFRVETSSSVTEYEYEILASNGKILDREKETKTVSVPSTKNKITKSKAISIALKNAGVEKKKALKLSAKKDSENGKSVYEVKFYIRKNGKLIEYDYTILISNGRILEKEVEVEAKAPSKVSGLKVKSKTDSSVTLKWSKSKKAGGYIIYKYNSRTNKYTKIGATKSLKYKITGLKENTNYTFAVRSYVRDEGITLPSTSYAKVSVKTTR